MISRRHPSRAALHTRTLHRLPHRVPQGGAGNFPLWLAPDPVRIITIGDDEAPVNYSKQIVNELRAHTMLVIGDRDLEAGAVSVRLHDKGNVGAKPKGRVDSRLNVTGGWSR